MLAFLALLAFVGLVGPSAWLLSLRGQARGADIPVRKISTPETVEVAYLMGGGYRAADTVITRMVTDGRIAVGSDGKVTVLEAVSHDAVERALLSACGADWSGSLSKLRTVLRWKPAMDTLERSLEARGLLLSAATRRSWESAANTQVAGLVVGATLGTGLLFAPGFLAVALLAYVLVVAGIVLRVKCAPPRCSWENATDLGAEYRAYLETNDPWNGPWNEERDEAARLAGLVARRGYEALPDGELRTQLKKADQEPSSHSPVRRASSTRKKRTSSSYSSFSSSSSTLYSSCSSGSSCSGSSSCSSSSCSSSSCSSSSCGSSS
ncbi:TIGR04222 domain-containing membrane protein [Streptomyces triculaminicus]|uniref:TIGR04222 domain-containing membrane protein n=2 Tax=Streptomyces TaxID=1883 RepID=A0A939JP42_9ACTN|nr:MULTISPECIES: TIGR04222 domain-containing membrane protein [Streptomyces]MBO0655991.1 TIGR04222 domain-containing membrane protein [Streptomyces triculaminicus]